jgi:hypothetical protein
MRVGDARTCAADTTNSVVADKYVRAGRRSFRTHLDSSGSRCPECHGRRWLRDDAVSCCSDWRTWASPTRFTLLRLLPGSDRDKDAEILALRHQLAVLRRQLDGQRVRFEPADRALLAALLSTLPRPALQNLRPLVQPDTILRWLGSRPAIHWRSSSEPSAQDTGTVAKADLALRRVRHHDLEGQHGLVHHHHHTQR